MKLSENNYQIIYLSIVYIYLIIGILYILEGKIPRVYLALVLFFCFKMITKYDKCTISYIECKLRNVKKEKGYLYDFLHSIIELRNTSHSIFIYIMGVVFSIFYFINQV